MKKALSIILTLALSLSFAACGAASSPAASSAASSVPTSQQSAPQASDASGTISQDRAGNNITLPQTIDTIISLAPAITQTLVHLGLADKLIAVDTQSAAVLEGLQEMPTVDIMSPDPEALISMAPSLIFASSLSMPGQEQPLKPVADTGICIAYIPTGNSIASIQEDILFLANVTGTAAAGQDIVAEMRQTIDTLKEAEATITQKKKVYFEIAAAPAHTLQAAAPTLMK